MNAKETELEARRAKAREELAAAEARRAARAADVALERDVEREELAARNAIAIADAEEKYGEIGRHIAIIETDLGVVIVKRPNHLLFRRYQDASKATTEAFSKLVTPCLVYPTVDAFERLLEQLPATLLRTANAVCALAGVRGEEVSGKS